MVISFTEVPNNIRVPIVAVELDASRGGVSAATFKSMLIGQRLATGRVAAGIPTQIGDSADAVDAFGRGSMLALMVEAFRKDNRYGELWATALDDLGAGVAATSIVTVTSPATGAGVVALYVAGRRIVAGVASGDAVAAIATSIVNAVNANNEIPVTAAAAGAIVTLTNDHAGAALDIDVRLSYLPDDALPAGVAITIAAGVTGAGNPDITGALDNIEDARFNIIAHPYTDATNVMALETELRSRWSALRANDGLAIGGFRGTLGENTTFGNGRNSQHSVFLDAGGVTINPKWEAAATLAGAVSGAAAADPARPFTGLALSGLVPVPVNERRDLGERNVLLMDGIAQAAVDSGGVVRIERVITTYQTNTAGIPDAAFLDANVLLTLSFLREDLRNTLSKFNRFKLADDGTRFSQGQPILTPSILRDEVIAWFAEQEFAGFVEGVDQFTDDLVVERREGDPNRIDVLMSPDLINQVRVIGVRLAHLI